MTDPLRAALAPLGCTPSQTVGPYLAIVLPWLDGPDVVPPGTPAMVTLSGRITDGAGQPVPDALIEVWQADPEGRFKHADDPRGRSTGFRGFGRCATGPDGAYAFHTVRPGALPDGAGGLEAPHLDVSVFARGLLRRLVTRVYFPDEPANDTDPVLGAVAPDERELLTAYHRGDGSLGFDVVLQGAGETPFFDL